MEAEMAKRQNVSRVETARQAGSTATKERYARVLARVPKDYHSMAMVLLRHEDMQDDQIVRACEIAIEGSDMRAIGASVTMGASSSRQELFAAGHRAAQKALGLPASDPLHAFADETASPAFDEALYAEGEAAGKFLASVIGMGQRR
jgi:hypothetical protein